MSDALTKLGEAARRAREYISPWAYFSPSDVASNLPGGGIPAAVEPYKQGLQKTAEATKAFREGRWGDAARWYGSGMLDTATAGLSALPEGGAMAKLAMAAAPAIKAAVGASEAGADGAGAMQKLSGIRAFHGSPHDFDRFDMSKIGTGEGAQAYGHGLYFAEAEDVAKGYRQRLAGPASVAVSGSTQQPFADLADATKRFIADNPAGHPVMDRTRQDIGSSVAKWLGEEAGGGPSAAPMIAKLVQEYPEEVRPQVQQWADEIVGYLRPMMKVEQPGRMYEVRINADPEHFLDWDKPLSEQSPKVREAAAKQFGFQGIPDNVRQLENGRWGMFAGDTQVGRMDGWPYRQIAEENMPLFADLEAKKQTATVGQIVGDRRASVPPDRVSQGLAEAGIPGIKYFDAGSRGAGDGTRNYVVFDDKLVEIIRKYGWMPGMAIPAAMALEMQQAQEQSAPQM